MENRQRSIDPVLLPLCERNAAVQADQILDRLMTQHAEPIIRKILNARFARLPSSIRTQWDYEDVYSGARSGLIRRLLRLRADPAARSVADFTAYVAKTTYGAWNDYIYSRHPNLAKIRNRLQYLLENRTTQKGFALWEDARGQLWCGFSAWSRNEAADLSRNARYAFLTDDPVGAFAAAFPSSEPRRLKLPELVAGLLRWIGMPIELNTLASAVADVLELNDPSPAPLNFEDGQPVAPALVDPGPLPSEVAKWREYLGWLAGEVARLPWRQRTAFLLRSSATQDFELHGILSIRHLAELLERPPEEVALLWKDLPLDDLAIARLLGLERQQVINLRSVARATLGRRWLLWGGRK